MGKYDGEQILVVKRSLFDELGAFQGATAEVERYLPSLLDPDQYFFMDREAAEGDANFKQLIPYCLFTYQDKVLHYLRGASGGESRLHAKGSVGVGGHINPIDEGAEAGEKTYRAGVEREIAEELELPEDFQYCENIIGLINDDSDEVGRVHLGVVHHVALDSPVVSSREDALHGLSLQPFSQLRGELHDSLESWSKLALQLLP